uniref:Uncharacterized protein n=1 Tax=Strongyloides venezuelensis TaxID=75913 RepID=A0A0K0F4W6_STRVS
MENNHCEKLSKIILQELMQDKSFQMKWLCDSLSRVILLTELRESNNSIEKKPIEPVVEVIHNDASTKKEIYELLEAINLSIETFLTNSQFVYCHMEYEKNQDAATIYSNKVLLDRLINSEKFNRDRLNHFIRRLRQCVKGFTLRISGSFQVVNCAFYAHSLVELFCNLGTYFEVHREKLGLQNELKRFEIISSEYSELVEKKLSNYLLSHSKSKSRDSLTKENHFITKNLRKDRRSRNLPRAGVLQPQYYNERHNKLKELASDVIKNKNLSESDLNRIKKKWKPLFDNHKIFYSSTVPTTYGSVGLHATNNITKSILNKIKKS